MLQEKTKFDCKRISSEPIPPKDLMQINKWRARLYRMGLLGEKDGVGFGNISVRTSNGFIISGSGTGGIEPLDSRHYTRVVHFDFKRNFLECEGPVDASSESLSHAAVYSSMLSANAVIHVHNSYIWNRLVGVLPTTSREAEYGTPELAYEIMRLLKDGIKGNVMVMGGHKEGILSFGKTLDEAGNALLKMV